MPDDLTPPRDGDAVNEPTPPAGAEPGPSREAYDIPEWVSEVRRLYVEPKTRAKIREESAGARHRRLSGIRPSRRTAAPTSPPAPTTPPAAPAAEADPVVTAASAAVTSSTPSGEPVSSPHAIATPATTDAAVPAPAAGRETPATEPAATDSTANGSGTSTVSEPWIPPTWGSARVAADTGPVDHHASSGVPATTDDDRADVAVAGSALARFALSADAAAVDARTEPREVKPEPEADAEPQRTLTMPVVVPAADEPSPARGAAEGPAAGVPPLQPVPAPPVEAPVPAPTGQDPPPAASPPDLRGAGPGRPHTVPSVNLSWREADSLDLGVPSVADSSDAIVLEPPSQLVADTRRRSAQRRHDEESEKPVEDAEGAGAAELPPDVPTPAGETADSAATRATTRAASRGAVPAARSRTVPGAPGRRVLLVAVAVAVILVLLVVGWLVLGGDGSDGAAAPGGGVTTTARVAPSVHPAALAT